MRLSLLAVSLLALLVPALPFAQPPRHFHSYCSNNNNNNNGLEQQRHRYAYRSTSALHVFRRCMLLGKTANHKARHISHSHVRSKRTQWVNLQWKKIWWPQGRKQVWLRLSTRAIKTINKHGIDEAAKRFDLNLTDYTLPFSEPRVIL